MLKPIDKLAGARPVQCHPLRKRVLIDPGRVVQMNEDGKLQRGKSGRFVHLRHYGDCDLVEAPPRAIGACAANSVSVSGADLYMFFGTIIIIYLMIRIFTK